MIKEEVKDIHFDKDDEQNLLKRKSKRKNGMVYGHNEEKSGFYQLEDLIVDSLNKNLKNVLNELLEFNKQQLEKNEKIKKALKHVLQENKKIKESLKKYGMVD